jgi:hypothetical protein
MSIASLRAADRSVDPIISHIPREPVESTALAFVGYSRRLHALEIEFQDGLIYRYLEVPTPTYRELMESKSKARFYNQHVRGKYRCLRVKPRRNA